MDSRNSLSAISSFVPSLFYSNVPWRPVFGIVTALWLLPGLNILRSFELIIDALSPWLIAFMGIGFI